VFIQEVSCVKVGATAQGISFYEISRFIIKFIVVLLEFYLPGCCMWANFMRFTPIGEVVVVSPNNNRGGCSSKKV